MVETHSGPRIEVLATTIGSGSGDCVFIRGHLTKTMRLADENDGGEPLVSEDDWAEDKLYSIGGEA
jgi:hypothetical protein